MRNRPLLRATLPALAFALALALAPGVTRAQVVLVSNESLTVDSNDVLNPTNITANQFSLTGGPWDVTSMSALLRRIGAGASASMQILSDAGGNPGSVLATSSTFDGTSLSTSTYTSVSFTFNTTLADGTYWAAVVPTSGFPDSLVWAFAYTPNTVGPFGTIYTPSYVQGASGQNGQSLMTINGVATAAVPEPSGLWLGAATVGAGAAVGLVRRRSGARRVG